MKRLFYVTTITAMIACSMTIMAQTPPTKKKTATPAGASSSTVTKPAATTAPQSTTPVKPAKTTTSSTGKSATDNPLSFGLNLEPALPLGDLKQVTSFGFGLNGMVKYTLTDKAALRGSLGYMTFPGKTITETEDDGSGNVTTFTFKPAAIHAVTLKAGASYMLTDNIFAQGSIGLAFLNNGAGTGFIYTPGIGYTAGHVELLLKYEGWSKNGTLSYLGLQLGYIF